MDGENEKGEREGAGGRGVGKLMTICACEQVSAKKEEEGGRRKANGKVCASKQVSTLSLLKLSLAPILGFRGPNMNRFAFSQSKHNGSVVSCGNLF